ncbi:MAG: efflux RND transporter periplasmic adaptor subunit [Rickettsiales bacterium]|jgi:multidrug efflux system membrane fusion protein|nr:efflux RND transporter periplasmic adaptor subunit [Rickettsiales bacterium]
MLKNIHSHVKMRYKSSRLGQKHPKIQVFWWCVIAIVAWFIAGYFRTKPVAGESAPSRMVKVEASRLNAQKVTADILLFGHTRADERVELKNRTAGTIEKIVKPKGSRVSKGETILKLKMDDREAKLLAARAAREKSKIEFDTAAKLFGENLISRVEFVQTEAGYKSAAAAAEQSALDIDYTSIKAPFDGVVSSLDYQVGQYLAVNTTIGLFLNLSTIRISAEIPEKFVSRARLGAVGSAKIVDGKSVDAVLSYVAGSASDATRTFAIELLAKNDGRIGEGMTAEVRLPLDSVMAVRLPSSSCLTFGDDGQIGVKTIEGGNKVGFYGIELVKDDGADGLWVSGLPETATVITSGQEFVSVGEEVDPRFAAPSEASADSNVRFIDNDEIQED